MGLSFLNPFLFALGGLILLPVLAHLIQRRRGREFFFPSIRFLAVAQEQYKRRVKLQSRHLLYMRALIFILLTFALAQPVIRMANTQLATATGRTSACLLIDSSYSMMANDNGVIRMDRARQVAKDALKVFKEGDQVALISFSGQSSSILAPLAPLSGLVQDRLEQVQATPFSSDIGLALTQAEALLRSAEGDLKEIYLVSDMQKSAMQNITSATSDEQKMNLHILSVGSTNAVNSAITELITDPVIVSRGSNCTLRATAEHFGTETRKRVPVQLFSGFGKASQVQVDLPVNVGRAVTFAKNYNETGLKTEEVRLEQDILPVDDTRYKVVPVAQQAQALILDGQPGAMEGRGSSFYLVKALEACGLGSRRTGSFAFSINTMKVPGDVPPVSFESYELVVLSDIRGFTDAAARSLIAYVNNGGAVLAFFGSRAEPTNLNRTLVPKLIPFPFMGPKRALDTDRESYYWRTIDYRSPVFELFSDLEKGNLALSRFTNYQILKYDSSAEERKDTFANANVLALYDSRDPAVVSVQLGKGRALVVTSSPDRTWNDFPLHSIFVPVLGEMVTYLSEAGLMRTDFMAGDSVQLSARFEDVLSEPVMLRLTGPQGEEYTVPAAPIGNSARGFFLGTNTPGFYRVSLPMGIRDGEVVPSVFSVNIDTSESDLAGATQAEVKELFGERYDVDFINPSPFIGARLARAREGLPLWNYLLILLWVIILFETWYANKLAQE